MISSKGKKKKKGEKRWMKELKKGITGTSKITITTRKDSGMRGRAMIFRGQEDPAGKVCFQQRKGFTLTAFFDPISKASTWNIFEVGLV